LYQGIEKYIIQKVGFRILLFRSIMKNILWLTEWLPTPLAPYSGDGIERRAIAASLYNNITIVYVKKKPGLRFGKVVTEERIYNEHCRAIIYYYPSIGKLSRFLDFFLSNYYFIKLHARGIKNFEKKYGKPSGIQVNVAMKNGIIALYYKWLRRINYIVMEGWSLFLSEAKPQFKDENWLFRFLARKVFTQASLLITVSNHLGKAICENVIDLPYLVIPSVVDKTIFFPVEKAQAHDVFRFIHISSLDYPKNFEQILQAVKIVIARGYKIELLVHGPDSEEVKKVVSQLGLQHTVIFRTEAPQAELAASMRLSHALILYSRYETFGNVIIEANACGLPVIVSDYPTFSEIVIEGVTGLIASGNNPQMLAEKMIYLVENYHTFNQPLIKQLTIEKYSYSVIGKLFDDVYEKVF
jgi:glycosyltransferase involved in cell wall biosynthesis